MPFLVNKNFCISILNGALTPSSTTLTLKISTGARFPQTGKFKIIIWSKNYAFASDDINAEISTCTLSSGDTLSFVTRGDEGTVAGTWAFGDNIASTLTGAKLDEIQNAIPQADGVVKTNFNADMVDGYHVGLTSGQIPINNGTKNANLNADLFDGYHAGNISGEIPINNGSPNSNLNADMVDGSHYTGMTVAQMTTAVAGYFGLAYTMSYSGVGGLLYMNSTYSIYNDGGGG